MDDLEKLKFPIGKCPKNKKPSKAQTEESIKIIEDFPNLLQIEIEGITNEELNWKYRPKGWTVKQVIHHCADSHMNSFIRFKLTLTEETPQVRPYFEDRWALLFDGGFDDVSSSMELLSGLHKRWIQLIKSLSEDQLKREYEHPEHGTRYTLEETIGIYAWHCNHHLAHVRAGRHSQGIYN